MGKGGFDLPELYWSSRVFVLLSVFVFLAVWLATGFDVYEGSVSLIAIQWSTVATVAFFFYLFMVNFQVGGVRSLEQLFRLVRMDLMFIPFTVRHHKQAAEQYPKDYIVNPFLAFFVSALISIGALLSFEVPWTFLYDWFQFHSVNWPINYAIISYGWYHGSIMIRNLGLSLLVLLGAGLLAAGLELQGLRSTGKKLLVSWRIDRGWLCVLAFTAWCWALWVYWPHAPVPLPASATDVIGIGAKNWSLSNCYVYPSEGLFPQNSYTFYPCSAAGVHYLPQAILGFFDPDGWIHGINVLTKLASIGAVCYPFMGIVRRNA
jgi:hypothetical protein